MMTALNPSLDLTLLALAAPTRRAILQRLSQGEVRVTDLAAPFPISLNSVSKHIRILERARLVRRRRAGKEHLLSLEQQALKEAPAWMAAQKNIWNPRRDVLEAPREAEDAPRRAILQRLSQGEVRH